MTQKPTKPVVRTAPAVAALGLLALSTLSAGIYPNGVNLQPSYYNGGNPNLGFSLMNQNSKIQSCRIEIEPDKVSQAKSWISQANSNGKTVIATYHKYTVLGTDSVDELNAAADWWRSNYSTLRSSGTIKVNLMNEWGSHNISSSAVASAYNSAISIVRQVYSDTIIVDCSGYGQETAVMSTAIKGDGGSTKINDIAIAPSIHVYPPAYNQGKGRWLDVSDLDDLSSAGRSCIVGEFGSGGSGGADWSGIVAGAKSRGWTLLGWAWNGDGTGMNMCSPAWSSSPGATSFSKSGYFNTIYKRL